VSTPTAEPGYTARQLTVHRSPERMRAVTGALRATGRRVMLVPTMGALHAGHRDLIRRAGRIAGGVVAVSIFVNPLQFGAGEDLARYPRPFESDLQACRELGVELVFAPGVDDMYPPDAATTVHPGPLGDELEGAVRPGHFTGVLTVVATLLMIVAPEMAFFGEKDYQQLVLIRRMVRDLRLGTRVVAVPTVREPDGLAMSSRNVYLDAGRRAEATVLSAALAAGAHAGGDGAAAVLDAASAVLARASSVDLDYLELRSPELGPAPEHGPARLLVAARLGSTRLIDNVAVVLGR
jgi:pantoate--beta-alanine ligase